MSALERVGSYLASYAWIPTLFAVGMFLDRVVKPEVKQQLAAMTFRHKSIKEMIFAAFLFVNIIYSPRKLSVFALRVAAVTTVSILVLTYVQLYVGDNAFQRDTLPFLRKLFSGETSCLLFMLGFYFVDMISTYFTIVVLRVSRMCNNIWEFMFLPFSDLVMSFLIVIFIMPVFISFAVLIKERPDRSYHVVVKSGMARQNAFDSSLWSTILLFKPTNKEELGITIRELSDKSSKVGWAVEEWSLIFRDDDRIKRDIASIYKSSVNTDEIFFQSKGIINREDAFKYLLTALSAVKEIRDVNVVESYESPLGDFYGLIEFRSDYKTTLDGFKDVYLETVKDINFIDDKLPDVVGLKSVRIGQNAVLANYNLEEAIRHSSSSLIVCDGSLIIDARDTADFIDASKYQHCNLAIAIRKYVLDKIKQMTIYEYNNEIKFPLSPFIMSSIVTTFFIYYCIFVFIVVNYAPLASSKFYNTGFVNDYIFRIYFAALLLLLAPIIVLI